MGKLIEISGQSGRSGTRTLELVAHRVTKRKPRGRKAAGFPDRRLAKWKVGDQHGHLTILGAMGRDKSRRRLVCCECDCGNQTVVRLDKIRSTDPKVRTTSCGHVKKGNSLRFNDDIAAKIALDVDRSNQIFTWRLHGKSAATIGARERLPKIIVDAVFRHVARGVMATKWMLLINSLLKRNTCHFVLAARTGLLPSTVAYIHKQKRQVAAEAAAA